MAKKVLLSEKLHLTPEEKAELKKRLKQLSDASGLPEYMSELLLNEIKQTNDEANVHLRERARMLGLMR